MGSVKLNGLVCYFSSLSMCIIFIILIKWAGTFVAQLISVLAQSKTQETLINSVPVSSGRAHAGFFSGHTWKDLAQAAGFAPETARFPLTIMLEAIK